MVTHQPNNLLTNGKRYSTIQIQQLTGKLRSFTCMSVGGNASIGFKNRCAVLLNIVQQGGGPQNFLLLGRQSFKTGFVLQGSQNHLRMYRYIAFGMITFILLHTIHPFYPIELCFEVFPVFIFAKGPHFYLLR
ncbi:hypothetical protein D3C85_886370 [compost metagenome]